MTSARSYGTFEKPRTRSSNLSQGSTAAPSDVVRSAVERKFEIIGEALGQIAKRDPGLARRIPDYRDIIAFRNLLIHGYATIEHARVWKIAQSSLPGLRATVKALLQEFGPA